MAFPIPRIKGITLTNIAPNSIGGLKLQYFAAELVGRHM